MSTSFSGFVVVKQMEVFFTSGSFVAMSGIACVVVGQFSSFNVRNAGPRIHRHSSCSPLPHIPRLASSAGLRFDLMWRHWRMSECSQIVATLLATKVWKRLSVFRMYWRTAMLSVQKTESTISVPSSCLNCLSVRAAITAAHNSKRGIVCCLIGASFALPNRKAM